MPIDAAFVICHLPQSRSPPVDKFCHSTIFHRYSCLINELREDRIGTIIWLVKMSVIVVIDSYGMYGLRKLHYNESQG